LAPAVASTYQRFHVRVFLGRGDWLAHKALEPNPPTYRLPFEFSTPWQKGVFEVSHLLYVVALADPGNKPPLKRRASAINSRLEFLLSGEKIS
jgi:hypothetical protein